MIRIGIIADSHFDEHSRFDECVRVHDWIATDGADRGVDLWLHSGDVFERRSTERERAAVADMIEWLSETAPVIIVRGNHDRVGELALYQRLRSDRPVIVEEHAGVHRVRVSTAAGSVEIGVAALAWPRKGELLAAMPGATDQDAAECLRMTMLGLGTELAHVEGPKLLLAHAMVRASRVSTGQPLVGCDFEIGLEDLALVGADFLALGHIHLGQDWDVNGAPCVYPGSPRRTSFGEDEAKGYLIVDFEHRSGRWVPAWQRIETPCTPMLLGEDEWRDGRWLVGWHGIDSFTSAKGAEVRLRYRVSADQRDAARAAAAQIADEFRSNGAVDVKVEEVVRPMTRARAPEIALAPTLAAKLETLWRARGIELSDERRARLIARAEKLESEAA